MRKLLNRLKCSACRCACVTQEAPKEYTAAYQLIELRNNGGLFLPSEGILKVLISAERHLRHFCYINKATNNLTVLRLQQIVLAEHGASDIFGLEHHIFDSAEGIDHHGIDLIRLTVSHFYTLRQHHIAKLHTLRLQGRVVRQSLNKTIIFKGQ